jgi:hypothetical protein
MAGSIEDVDLGVAEDPEEVLPEDGLAAGGQVEEVGAELAVEHQCSMSATVMAGKARMMRKDGDERHPGEAPAGASWSCPWARMLMMVTDEVRTRRRWRRRRGAWMPMIQKSCPRP